MKTLKERCDKQRKNINPDIKKHYTPEDIVKRCIREIPYNKEDIVLDVGNGLNMVWYNNLKHCKKDWVEIDKGKDFFKYNKKVDWCIGNPPYRELWKVIEHTTYISKKGFAFLVAIDGINRLTPKRLVFLGERGFYLNKIYVMNIKLWWGRYFLLIFTKNNEGFFNILDDLKESEKE